MVLPASGCSLWQSWEWGSSLDSSFACSRGLGDSSAKGHKDDERIRASHWSCEMRTEGSGESY